MAIRDVTFALRAIDLSVARDFYVQLGLAVEIDEVLGEGVLERPFRRLRLNVPGSAVFVEFFPDLNNITAVPALTLTVDDIHERVDRLVRIHAASIQSVDSTPFGTVVNIIDPSGNALQIVESGQ